MVFFLKVLAFVLEITNIWQKSWDFWMVWFFLRFLIPRLLWTFLCIIGCFVSFSSMFHFDLYKYPLYLMLFFLLKTSFESIFEVYYCAAEAIFCYTAENSRHLKAQVTPKNPLFQEEKTSLRRKARSHVTSEKSSKNYISLCEGKPARGLPTPSPHPSASRYRTFYTWWTASAIRKCEIYSRESLAGGGRAGWLAKQCHSLTDHRIDCKFKTKIANTIPLLCYLNKICLTLTGGFWQALANLHSGERL